MAHKTPAPEPIGVLRGHGAPVNAVSALSSTTVVSGGADGVVKLWSLRTRRESASIQAHSKAGILHVTRFNDGSRVITHGRDGYISLWDTGALGRKDAQPLMKWYCGSFTFTKAATMRWSEDDSQSEFASMIVSPSSEEKDIVLYDARQDSSKVAMKFQVDDTDKKHGMCMSLSLFEATTSSQDGARHPFIAVGWEGGQLSLLDPRAGGKVAVEAQVANTTEPLLAFDVTHDGRSAICGSAADDLSMVSMDLSSLTMEVKPFFKCNHGGISAIRLRSDERIFATAGWDHRVRIFHRRTLKPLAILKYHTESVFGVDFTPDNQWLLSASKDQKLALWSIYPPSEAKQKGKAT
ncbi:hypothetical protein Poli38472_002294 [Pythium oligandrum]|uniref:Guanine nucleotide-binding protein subunit beta-like protein n=1 Tax=Pythium oligandrum TaxID=41045 RepID=A0A8K1CJ15_PYTOL|nr:hypothetical protein Poli38472_002294 [Pythium oligandrum]|eukprot:TMW63353.1 hypothetical protein Poli38472_002294 [Pythium oligandrum]